MRKASFQMDFDLRWKTIFICSVTVHTRVPSNRILPMLRIQNRQNLLPELYHMEFSVQKIPTRKQLLCIQIQCPSIFSTRIPYPRVES